MKLMHEEQVFRRSMLWPSQQVGTNVQAGSAKTSAPSVVRLAPDERHVERVLAMARALLVGSLLAAIYLTAQALEYESFLKIILVSYCVYSAGLIAFFRKRLAPTVTARNITHALDILWAGGLMVIFSGSLYSPFVVFLSFPLLAASMRWGLRATMVTAGATIAMLMTVTLTIDLPSLLALHPQRAAESRFPVGSVYLLVLGFSLGYLGEYEKRLRSEATAVARVTKHAHQASTPNDTVAAIFEELFHMFAPAQVQLAVHEIPTGRIHLWESNKADMTEVNGTQKRKLVCRELDFSFREDLFFENPGYLLFGHHVGDDGFVHVRMVDEFGKSAGDQRVQNTWMPPNRRAFLSVPLVFGDEWEVRIFVWDPVKQSVNAKGVRVLADVASRLSPTIFTAALQQHLRSRAVAEERARFARELHDGIMQSLVALDLKIEVMKKICPPEPSPLLPEVNSIQRLIRSEVMNLRELIQHTRRIEIGPTQLLPFLANTVSTFQRETGITARFICELEEVNLRATTCYEVARIVQEALTNVRKHSEAMNVIVRFAEHGEQWILVITDDGKGFNFVGHYTLAELDAARKGPAVIKERVRAISGNLSIESGPEKGARLEVTFPKEN